MAAFAVSYAAAPRRLENTLAKLIRNYLDGYVKV
jgi:hypothetical protein